MELRKGKYEIFKVGDERTISDSRDKIKEYANEKVVGKISYIMSVDNIDGFEGVIKKL